MSYNNLDFNEFIIEIDLKAKSRAKLECDKLDDLVLYTVVTNDGEPINLADFTYEFHWTKADGKYVIQDTVDKMTILDGHLNVLQIECERECTRENGNALAEIVLFKDGKRKASKDINITINPSVIDEDGGPSVNVITSVEILKEEVETSRITLENVRDEARRDIDRIKSTGNYMKEVNISELTLKEGWYEAEVQHNCNSMNIHVTLLNLKTYEVMMSNIKIIDRNKILIRLDDVEELSKIGVIISASYYKATVDLNTDITADVIESRAGYDTLNQRLNVIESRLSILK